MAAFSAFLIRQPVTIAVKVNSGRRPRRDLPAAWFWIMVYALLGLLSLAGLIALGYGFVLFLAIPAASFCLAPLPGQPPRRTSSSGSRDRCQWRAGIGCPAAYWVGMGAPDPLGWWLFLLTWAQSAASIVYAYLRLEQRNMLSIPTIHTRLRQGRRALIYATFNVASVTILSILEILPLYFPCPMLYSGPRRSTVHFVPPSGSSLLGSEFEHSPSARSSPFYLSSPGIFPE